MKEKGYDPVVQLVGYLISNDLGYIPDFDECVKYVKNNVQEDDIVITIGAGTVTEIGPMLVK